MDFVQGDEFRRKLLLLFLMFSISHYSAVNAVSDTKYKIDGRNVYDDNIKFVFQEQGRYRREATQEPAVSNTTVSPAPVLNNTASAVNTTQATSGNTNATTTLPTPTNTTASTTENASNNKQDQKPANATAVTNTHLLGENCTGIYHGNTTNYTLNGNVASGNTSVVCNNNTPKVSEPISPDENFTDMFTESLETIKAEQNLTKLVYDNHTFYQSVFIGNLTTFNEHWAEINKPKAEIHPVLSNSHRRATTLKLEFGFPFYGLTLNEVTIATGGFIYTGDHVHHWLAATQYIAPLMANFDTSIGNNSFVKLSDDGEKFTAIWENVSLQEKKNETFTFAATLYKNGDIVFAYKDMPVSIKDINDTKHPVKVGISDAYLTDNIMFYVRRKTIYEYHRVNFKNYDITNGTLLRLIALPTCLQHNTCGLCLNNTTGFNCNWCEQLQRCSSGTDRTKQDWTLRNCDKLQITSASSCPAPLNNTGSDNNLTYITDKESSRRDPLINIHEQSETFPKSDRVQQTLANVNTVPAGHSPIGGFVAAFLIITLISATTAWILYAFKNPHTRSGQLLIKYRPSQWSWRRGEARYTAATIHM